jgi:hypothetical protein
MIWIPILLAFAYPIIVYLIYQYLKNQFKNQ